MRLSEAYWGQGCSRVYGGKDGLCGVKWYSEGDASIELLSNLKMYNTLAKVFLQLVKLNILAKCRNNS